MTHERISIDPKVMFGKPVIKGTRIPVATLLMWLGKGMSTDEVLREYPSLTRDDVLAALRYASEYMSAEVVLPAAE
ncbi:MAG: DUF433 domain-containing protein [Alphaproteobacteria bacterium]|nr:DUF433 domain-containing protein [Alphaproteobacteria bacterium]